MRGKSTVGRKILLFADVLPGRTTLDRIAHLGGGRAFTVLRIHRPDARVRASSQVGLRGSVRATPLTAPPSHVIASSRRAFLTPLRPGAGPGGAWPPGGHPLGRRPPDARLWPASKTAGGVTLAGFRPTRSSDIARGWCWPAPRASWAAPLSDSLRPRGGRPPGGGWPAPGAGRLHDSPARTRAGVPCALEVSRRIPRRDKGHLALLASRPRPAFPARETVQLTVQDGRCSHCPSQGAGLEPGPELQPGVRRAVGGWLPVHRYVGGMTCRRERAGAA
jgi:hypothetical protein